MGSGAPSLSCLRTALRYQDDIWDRFWWSQQSHGLVSINTSFNLSPTNFSESVSSTDSKYQPPLIVMQTAIINPDSKGGMQWSSTSIPQNAYFFMCIHFAELKKLNEGEIREFDITLDSKPWHDPFIPIYRVTTSICSTSVYRSQNNLVEYNPTSRSTLSPIVNAMELYSVLLLSGSTTNDADASSLVDIKDKYQITKAWTGDPCLPINYTWEGLVCNNDTLSPRVISLDLSNSGLSGEIPQSLAKFSAIVSLNLSGNNLTGNIPIFLAPSLAQLSTLDLSDNNLSGCVPDDLLHKSKSRSLKLRLSGNDKLLSPEVCASHKKRLGRRITIGATISAAVLSLLVASSFIITKMKKSSPGENPGSKGSVNKSTPGCQVFTYSEVVEITNDFKHKIGEGGFGPVFLGHVHGQAVAVKILSHKSKQGSKEFNTEVALLSRVHHRNIVYFVGYCDEANRMILIYEYLPKGNLRQVLSKVDLDWNQRLQIALCAAQGLEYLHYGCKPAIIHRDVKSANILLNDKLVAKIADFGLSKSEMPDDYTHVSTAVAGTPGYLDPEYSTSCCLNEKSDVYSFGVVLLELICGRIHVIEESSGQRIHIVEWVRENLLRGNHENVVDTSLAGKYDVSSFWKVANMAIECTADKRIKRPNMNNVVIKLKEAIAECNTVSKSEDPGTVAQQESEPFAFYDNSYTTNEEITISAPR